MKEIQLEPATPPDPEYAKTLWDWSKVAEQARAGGGEWFKLPVPMSHATIGYIQMGKNKAISPDEFEVVARDNRWEDGKRRADMYIRLKVKDTRIIKKKENQ